MRILFFGKPGDILGEAGELGTLAGETVAQPGLRLADLGPEAAGELLSARNRACVGDTVVGEDRVLSGRNEVELLPPLSGG
jgi:molybdopterin converting factor small subunit